MRPDLRRLVARYRHPTFDVLSAVANQAGFICANVKADILFDMIVGTLLYRALFSLEDVPDGYADQATRQIILGLAPA